MEGFNWSRGAAAFSASYIKRWLEDKYDQLMDLPVLSNLKKSNAGPKLGVEAILYALTSYAEQKLSGQSSPLLLWLRVL